MELDLIVVVWSKQNSSDYVHRENSTCLTEAGDWGKEDAKAEVEERVAVLGILTIPPTACDVGKRICSPGAPFSITSFCVKGNGNEPASDNCICPGGFTPTCCPEWIS